MSTRINSHYKTSTSQIVRLLDNKELSFQQLSDALHIDEEELSRDLDQLVRDAVITRRFHNHHVTYTRMPYPLAFLFNINNKQKNERHFS